MAVAAGGGRRTAGGGARGGPTPPARLVAWSLLAVTAFVLFAHGCHGPDEDHEPSAAPPAARSGADRE